MSEIRQFKDDDEDGALTKYTNIELTYSDSAMMKVKILAGGMKQLPDGEENTKLEFYDGVHVYFYDQNGNVNTEMESQRAVRYDAQMKMEAFEDVVVFNEKKEQLNTEHLVWEEKKDLIHTEKHVKITTANDILLGEGLESNATFTKYKILKPTGSFQIEEK